MADETGLATNPAMPCNAALAENLSARSQSAERWSSTTMRRSAPISVDLALERVRTSTPRLGTETVETASALGRVLASPAATAHPLPPFDQSAVDGYAIRRFDLTASSTTLSVMSVVAAGAGLDPSARWRLAVSPEGVRQLDDRTMWLRCRATTDEHGAVRFTTLRHQGSHMLSNLALANALARVPPCDSADDQQPPVLSWLDLDAP